MDNQHLNPVKEALITACVNARIRSIRDNGDEEEWMADVMNFGWIGYDRHTDEELLASAEMLGIEDIPTLEQLQE